MKASEKELKEEKKELQEKIKNLKAELASKKTTVNDLKSRIEKQGGGSAENSRSVSIDKKDGADANVKKYKSQIKALEREIQDRDKQFSALKSKLEAVMAEVAQLRAETFTQQKNDPLNLSKELKRNEQSTVQLKQLETAYQNILKRLYRDLLLEVKRLGSQKLKQPLRDVTDAENYDSSNNRYKEPASLLNISPEDVYNFIDPKNSSNFIVRGKMLTNSF